MANWFTKNFLSGKSFFNFFQQAGANVVTMAELLSTVMETEVANDRSRNFTEIDRLEKAGDQISHKIYLMLDQVSFPPLGKADIHSLTSAIDDVADYIQETTGRINLYRLECIYPPMQEMARVLLRGCLKIDTLLHQIETEKDNSLMLTSCKQVKDIESQTDQIYYRALASLFDEESDAIELLKKREILHSVECAVNKCKSVADVIEAVIIKRL